MKFCFVVVVSQSQARQKNQKCHPPAGSSFIDLPKGEGLKPWSGVAGLPKGTGPTAVL